MGRPPGKTGPQTNRRQPPPADAPINPATGRVDRVARAAATPPKPCIHCGKPMPRLLHHTDERWEEVRFCSTSCAGKVYGNRPRPGIFMRLYDQVLRMGPDECWPWQGKSVHQFGYGRISGKLPGSAARSHNAPRVAYVQEYGPVPEGMVVRHDCDNPLCCNPAHLQLGTPADNVADTIKRGRGVHRSGKRTPESYVQFTPETVQKILAAYRVLPKTNRGYALPGAMPALAQAHGITYLRLLRLLKKYGESRLNYVDKD